MGAYAADHIEHGGGTTLLDCSLWRVPLLHGLEERCALTQRVGIVADQRMSTGWKEDDPPVGHTGGNKLRAARGAEPIVFGADR